MNEIVETVSVHAGIMFRSVLLPVRGTTIPQHTHPEAHATFCGQGAAALYVDDKYALTLVAGKSCEIAANKKHLFEALEDNTRLVCVWDEEAAKRMEKTVWPG